MLPVNSINSQNINFGRLKKTKDNGEEKKPWFKKPSIKGFGGGKSMSDKYGDIPLTTKTAKILLGDNIIDHALELGITTAAFLTVFAKGKKLMTGVTGSLVDSAAKNVNKQDGVGVLKSFRQYVGRVAANISETKEKASTTKLIEGLEESKALNSGREVLAGSVVEKIADKADNEKSLVYKAANSKTAKKIILGKEAKAGDAKIGADELKEFSAKKLGITRGADIVDTAAATVLATGVASGANTLADAGTDLNDSSVAEKARMLLENEDSEGYAVDKDGNLVEVEVLTPEEIEELTEAAEQRKELRKQQVTTLLAAI